MWVICNSLLLIIYNCTEVQLYLVSYQVLRTKSVMLYYFYISTSYICKLSLFYCVGFGPYELGGYSALCVVLNHNLNCWFWWLIVKRLLLYLSECRKILIWLPKMLVIEDIYSWHIATTNVSENEPPNFLKRLELFTIIL